MSKLVIVLIKCVKNVLIGVIAILVLLYFIYGGWWEWSMYKPLMTKKFDKEEWRLAGEEMDYENRVVKNLERRCGMYHDLTRNHMHKGMSIKEVEELLGAVGRWHYCDNGKIKCMNYGMGTCYSNALSVVPMSVHACFNKKGLLVTYDREQHCKIKGSYDIKAGEQSCFREGPGGTGVPSNDCGITPW